METYQILLDGHTLEAVLDDWMYHAHPADIRLRHAKTPNHYVLETTNPIYGARVVDHFCPKKVNIKK